MTNYCYSMNTMEACAMADACSFMRFFKADILSIAAAMLIFAIKAADAVPVLVRLWKRLPIIASDNLLLAV